MSNEHARSHAIARVAVARPILGTEHTFLPSHHRAGADGGRRSRMGGGVAPPVAAGSDTARARVPPQRKEESLRVPHLRRTDPQSLDGRFWPLRQWRPLARPLQRVVRTERKDRVPSRIHRHSGAALRQWFAASFGTTSFRARDAKGFCVADMRRTGRPGSTAVYSAPVCLSGHSKSRHILPESSVV